MEGRLPGPRASDPSLHLVEEINHRVVNEFAEAIAGLSLAARRSVLKDVRLALEDAAQRLQAHAESHRALLAPVESEVNLADYLGRLCETYSRATLADRRVRLVVQSDEIWLPADRAWRIGLAMAELIRNAARHGLRGGPGAIAVQILRNEDEIVCLVQDDGQGAEELRPGRGVALVRTLATELGGSADWGFSPQGSIARLRAPHRSRTPTAPRYWLGG